jgi:hypothetical protein
MRAGDLDNRIGASVGFRVEECLLQYGKIDAGARAHIEHAMFTRGQNLYLITLLPERSVQAKCYKWGVPYTKVFQVDSVLEIPELCRVHSMLEYYDRDVRVLESIGNVGFQTKGIKWTSPEDFSPNSLMKTD